VVAIIPFCGVSNYVLSNCMMTYGNSSFKPFESRSWRGILDTTLCNKVCQ
jgi:hypothetical protein